MDLMKLDTSTWLPTDMVEGYSSLIWTERYLEAGEVQIKTPLVEGTMDLIPDGSVVAIRESDEVMYIETHSISKDDNGAAELTVKGRTFETFLERRYMVNADYNTPWVMWIPYTVQDAVAGYIWDMIVNVNPVLWSTSNVDPHTTLDNIPNMMVTQTIVIEDDPTYASGDDSHGVDDPDAVVTDLQTKKDWYIQPGQMYQHVTDLLTMGKIGIRMVRPRSAKDLPTTQCQGFNDGTLNHSSVSNVDQLRFDIYNGRNRSLIPAVHNPLTPVIFRYDAGHLSSPQYLISRKDYRNFALVASLDGNVEVFNGSSEPFWLDRHAMYVDAGNVDSAADPDKFMHQKGLTELRKANRQILLDAGVAMKTPYVYGVEYNLGDFVSVIGEYGVNEIMQVTEYVRTEDATGDSGYPTLIHKVED